MQNKVIPANLGIFRHIRELFIHIQEYSEQWYIQKPGIFRIRGIVRALVYSEVDVYSEPWLIANPKHIQNPFKHPR